MQSTEPAPRLRAAALAYVRFAVDRPDMFALVFRHDILANSGMHLRGTSLPLFAFVTALVEPLAGTDAHVRAVQIWTAVHGIAALGSSTALSVVTDVDSTALVDAAVESIVRSHQPARDLTDAGSRRALVYGPTTAAPNGRVSNTRATCRTSAAVTWSIRASVSEMSR